MYLFIDFIALIIICVILNKFFVNFNFRFGWLDVGSTYNCHRWVNGSIRWHMSWSLLDATLSSFVCFFVVYNLDIYYVFLTPPKATYVGNRCCSFQASNSLSQALKTPCCMVKLMLILDIYGIRRLLINRSCCKICKCMVFFIVELECRSSKIVYEIRLLKFLIKKTIKGWD